MIQEAVMRAQKVEPRAVQNYARALKPNQATPNPCLARFQNFCGAVIALDFPFSSLLNSNVCSCYLSPVPPSHIGCLVSDFRGTTPRTPHSYLSLT